MPHCIQTPPPLRICMCVCLCATLKFATRACINSKFDRQCLKQSASKALKKREHTHTHVSTFSRNAKYRSEPKTHPVFLSPDFGALQTHTHAHARIPRRANAHSTCISVKCVCVCALMQYIGAVRNAQRALICLKQTPLLTWSALGHWGKRVDCKFTWNVVWFYIFRLELFYLHEKVQFLLQFSNRFFSSVSQYLAGIRVQNPVPPLPTEPIHRRRLEFWSSSSSSSSSTKLPPLLVTTHKVLPSLYT